MLEMSDFKNRRIKPKAVQRYAEDMRHGDWDCFSFEPLSFDKNGNLLNGQHRLNAVIKAGVAVPFYIATEVNQKAAIYDRGVLRSTSDVFEMNGIHTTRNEVSTVKWIFKYVFNESLFSDSQIKKYYTKHQKIIRQSYIACNKGGKGIRSITKRAAIIGSAYQAIRCNVGVETISSFMSVVNNGFQSYNWESAAVVARNYLLEHRSKDQNINDRSIDMVFQKAIFDYDRKKARHRIYDETTEPPYRNMFIAQDKEEIEEIFKED